MSGLELLLFKLFCPILPFLLLSCCQAVEHARFVCFHLALGARLHAFRAHLLLLPLSAELLLGRHTPVEGFEAAQILRLQSLRKGRGLECHWGGRGHRG